MAEVLGYHSALDLALPTGIDAKVIKQRELAENYTTEDLIEFAARVSVGATRAILDKYGYMISLTVDDYVYYPDGSNSGELPVITELSRIEFVHGQDIGHMLPMRWYGHGTGITRLGQNGIRPTQIEATYGILVQEALSTFGKQVETRLFTNTVNSIGSAGFDMPFVRGTSSLPSGAPQYTPPAYDGQTFAATHNHFVANSDLETLLNNMCETLDEHGLKAPFDAVISSTDLADYRGLTGFVESVDSSVGVIDLGGRTNRPIYYSASELDTMEHGIYGRWRGNYGMVRLRPSHRVPTGYAAMFKSAGQLSAANPIRVKYAPVVEGRSVPFGVIPVLKEGSLSVFPIEGVGILFSFGAGVGNRLNGAVGRNASAFSNPTIT